MQKNTAFILSYNTLASFSNCTIHNDKLVGPVECVDPVLVSVVIKKSYVYIIYRGKFKIDYFNGISYIWYALHRTAIRGMKSLLSNFSSIITKVETPYKNLKAT